MGRRRRGIPGRPKPRALLALLLLHAKEVVPADRLIDELWGKDSPERAVAVVGYLSGIRSANNFTGWEAAGGSRLLKQT
jgi:DNA-binding SARP family transcriptional activator